MSGDLDAFLSRFQACRRLINIAPAPVRITVGTADTAQSGAGGDAIGTRSLLLSACDAFEIAPVVQCDGVLTEPTALERIVAHHLGLDQDPTRIAVCGRCSRGDARAAIERVAAADPRRQFRIHTVSSSRGAQLTVCERGSAELPAWVLVLPYGVPVEISFTLAREVSSTYRFITFEGPDLQPTTENFDRCTHGIDQSAGDILAVLDHFSVERAHIVGLCAAALPTLQFAVEHSERVSSLILGNGAYSTKSASPLDFISLAERVGGQRAKAKVFYKFMSAQDLTAIEPEFPHLTMMPFANPALLYMYTTAFKCCYTPDLDARFELWMQRMARPALVVLGDCDKTVPPEGSRRAASQLRQSRLLVDPEGTHLSLLREPKRWMLDAMLQFCKEHDGDGERQLVAAAATSAAAT